MVFNLKSIKYTIVIILSLLFTTGCISRLSQPEIKGVVKSQDLIPLVEVLITNSRESVLTDSKGNFLLPEHRYNAFLLKELFYMEAPPLNISLQFKKEGYQPCDYRYFSHYGGGARKGSSMNLGSILLIPTTRETTNNATEKCKIISLP